MRRRNWPTKSKKGAPARPNIRAAISQVKGTDGAKRYRALPFLSSGRGMLKTTPLNTLHRAAGARMVDFAGWEMPASYGSQIEEHHAVRRDAGMFDVSHMLAIDLRGDGARGLLRYALANNVDKLMRPGKALYSCLLKADGGVLDDLIVYFIREDA